MITSFRTTGPNILNSRCIEDLDDQAFRSMNTAYAT